MPVKLAIVCTFIRAQAVLKCWVDRHRALGIETFYLFADDPTEMADYQALDLGDVHLIARDEVLVADWQSLPGWSFHGRFSAQQVYSRQCLNTDVALRDAKASELDWLIHLDIDEALHVPAEHLGLADYLAAKSHFDMVAFTNHEAVPEHWHIDNYFEEVTLFKRNRLVLDDQQRRIANDLFGQQYFLAYGNGKSAVNLRGSATEADGGHAFRPVSMVHIEAGIVVLHYTHCGFNWFHSKFVTLGDFHDHLMDSSDITAAFPMLAEGRQSVVRGSIHDATRLYRDRVLHQGGLPYSANALLQAGVLVRIGDSPLQTL